MATLAPPLRLRSPATKPGPSRETLFEVLEAWESGRDAPLPGDPDQLHFGFEATPLHRPQLPSGLRELAGHASLVDLVAALERWHQRQLPTAQRKRLGQFATPPRLVHEIVAAAFAALELPANRPLQLLEPAAGFGIFALAALAACAERDLECELVAIEQDPLAEAMVRTLTASAQSDHPHLALDIATQRGDFLLDDCDLEPERFDCILGNPPFVAHYARDAHALPPAIKRALKSRYRFAQGRINSSVLFLERALELLRPGGILAFVVPSALFHLASWSGLREWLLAEHELLQVRYCGEWAFSADVPTGVLVVRKGHAGSHQPLLPWPVAPPTLQVIRDASHAGGAQAVVTRPEIFQRFPGTIFTPHVDRASLEFLDRMEAHAIPLAELFEIRDGINPANLAQLLIHDSPTTPEHKPLLRGSNIQPFQVQWSGAYVHYDQALIDAAGAGGGYAFLREEWIFQAPVKLVHRQTADRLIAAVDSAQHYVLNSVHCSIPRPPFGEDAPPATTGPRMLGEKTPVYLTDPWLLCALYNSGPLNRYYRLVFCEIEQTFPQVKTANLRRLPIPRLPRAQAFDLAQLARQIAHTPLPLAQQVLRERLDTLAAEAYEVPWPPPRPAGRG